MTTTETSAPRPLVGTGEVARQLRVSTNTVIRRVEAGTLTPIGKICGPAGAYVFDCDYIASVVQKAGESR